VCPMQCRGSRGSRHGYIEHYFGSDFRLNRLRAVLDCWRQRLRRTPRLGDRRGDRIQIVSQHDGVDVDNLASTGSHRTDWE